MNERREMYKSLSICFKLTSQQLHAVVASNQSINGPDNLLLLLLLIGEQTLGKLIRTITFLLVNKAQKWH